MEIFRLANIALACCLIQACQNQSDTDSAEGEAELTRADSLVKKIEQSAPVQESSRVQPAAQPLNMSLPEDYEADDSPLTAAEDDDKNVFNANAAAKDRKVKFNSKVHIKEGTTLNSAVDGQGDAIEGAEFGVEYKIP